MNKEIIIDPHKPGRNTMRERIEHTDTLSAQFVKLAGKDLWFRLFQYAFEPLKDACKNRLKLPLEIDYFTFESFEFVGKHPPHPQNPFLVSGYYKKDNIHFSFQIRKSSGMRELLQFKNLNEIASEVKKECVCDFNLILRDGCHCGAITRYKPKY